MQERLRVQAARKEGWHLDSPYTKRHELPGQLRQLRAVYVVMARLVRRL